jgi:hypothetical protein
VLRYYFSLLPGEWVQFHIFAEKPEVDGGQGVIFSQFVKPEVALRAGRLQAGILERFSAFSGELQLVAPGPKLLKKSMPGSGGENGGINILADHVPISGLTVFLCLPLRVAFGFMARTLHNGEGILPAEPVRYLPHPGVVLMGIVKLDAVCK